MHGSNGPCPNLWSLHVPIRTINRGSFITLQPPPSFLPQGLRKVAMGFAEASLVFSLQSAIHEELG